MTLTFRPFAKSEPRQKDDAVSRIMAQMNRDMAKRIGLAKRIVDKMARKGRFADGITSHLAQERRNPASNGGTSSEARLRGAAGHDSRGKYKVSGPATPFGQPGRSTKLSSR